LTATATKQPVRVQIHKLTGNNYNILANTDMKMSRDATQKVETVVTQFMISGTDVAVDQAIEVGKIAPALGFRELAI